VIRFVLSAAGDAAVAATAPPAVSHVLPHVSSRSAAGAADTKPPHERPHVLVPRDAATAAVPPLVATRFVVSSTAVTV
jgi:hypothetical protein